MIKFLIAMSIAVAQPTAIKQAMERYPAELRQRCPAKHLEWLGPAVLQSELLAFKVPNGAKERMSVGWRRWCDPDSFDSSCGNNVALEAIANAKLMGRFVDQLCASWAGCEEQSVCDRGVKR